MYCRERERKRERERWGCRDTGRQRDRQTDKEDREVNLFLHVFIPFYLYLHALWSSVHLSPVAVVVAFFICWAPFHTYRLLYVYAEERSSLVVTVHNVLFYVSGVTYYISATINPVLYR